MNTLSPNRQSIAKGFISFGMLLLAPIFLFAQGGPAGPTPATADQFVGHYKGTAKTSRGAVDLKIEIRANGGELYGRVSTPRAAAEGFSPSRLAEGKLKIRLGAAGAPETLVLELREGKLVGVWQVGQEARAVTFERVPAPSESAVVAAPKAPEPSAAQLLTGEWEAVADAQGQSVPFTLVLKVEGEKVTGNSSSQLGDSTISSGTWKDGKLAVVLDGSGSQIALVGSIVEGKLVGDYDYNGQLQGKWVAAKKKQ